MADESPSQPQPVTAALARFVSGLTWERVPAAAREEAVRAIVDCVGSALAALETEPARKICDLVAAEQGEHAVWCTPIRTTERNAALANGVMAHVHDIDDTNDSMRGHPSVTVVPALFALAERQKATGAQVLTAYVAGLEVEAKLGRAMNMEHYERGWHTTLTLGSLGAAAACANLLALDEARSRHALGLAASLASGVRANFGTMTKPLHAGLAAQNGVLAARLAERDFTANPSAIEAKEGFFDLFCGRGNVKAGAAVAGLGEPFDVIEPGLNYKLYPTCSLTHCAIDILLEGMREGLIDPAGIEKIRCAIGYRYTTTLPYPRPVTGYEGKFSLEYCIAAALIHGRVGFDEFEDRKVTAPEVGEVYAKLDVFIHPELRDRESVGRDFTEIDILHRDGRRFHRRLSKPKGSPANPLGPEEVAAKFTACAAPGIGGARAARLLAALGRLPDLDARELSAIFHAPASRPEEADWNP